MFEKDYEFLKKKLHLRKKKFQRTRELDFWQSWKIFKAKNRKVLFQRPHWWREILIFFHKLQIWANFSCGQEEFSSGVHAKKSRQNSLFSCGQRPTKMEKLYIFRQIGFSSSVSWTQKQQFRQLCGNLSPITQSFFLNVRNFSQKTYKIFRKTVFVQTFPWTLRMQFRHSCFYVICCSQIFLLFKLQKIFNSVPTSAEFFFLRVFPGHKNSIFGNPAEINH